MTRMPLFARRVHVAAMPGWPAVPRWTTGIAVGFGATALAYAVLTGSLWGVFDTRDIQNVALLYLLLTLVVSAIWGYRVGLAAAVTGDLLVNFFFVPPLYRFTVQRPANVAALAIFLCVAAVGASMLALLRGQARVAEARRAETRVLLDLSQEIAHSVSPRDALQRLCSAIARALGARGCAILQFEGSWAVVASTGEPVLTKDDEAMATEAVRSGENVRFGTAALASLPARKAQGREHAVTFVPFRTGNEGPGALRIAGHIHPPALVDASRLLTAFADEASVAVHRARLAEEARRVEALQRANEFKSVILSSVSHDLRSPLTAIKASVGSLRDQTIQWSPEDTESFLETIESQADRLTATVAGLLQMSRLEGGAVQPRLEAVEVLPLFHDAIAAVPGIAEGRPVELQAAGDVRVRADYTLILQALVNLIENADRYSTPGARIAVYAEAVGPAVKLSVRDQGPGIPPAGLPHIFEKFYRGQASVPSQGTGLGLAIVEAMVKLSGGTITVRSSAEGTVFTIELPAAAPS
ncbi:MAG: sensor histidine kinase [Tepidiformaceae bacterium]